MAQERAISNLRIHFPVGTAKISPAIDRNHSRHARVNTGGLERDPCSRAEADQDKPVNASGQTEVTHRLLSFTYSALPERYIVLSSGTVPDPGKIKSHPDKSRCSQGSCQLYMEPIETHAVNNPRIQKNDRGKLA